MVRHELKTLPQYFNAQLSGIKNFEIRENDRDYNVGDELLLREIHPRASNEKAKYTGRKILLSITYILAGSFEGLGDGHAILSTHFIVEIS